VPRSNVVGAALLSMLLALGALPSDASAAPPTRADALAAIAAYAPLAREQQGTPGLAVVVTDAKAVLQTLTLGYANVDAKQPVTPRTRFPIGSITKSMTALSLMQLVDAGKLDVQAPVRRYLPDFRIASHGIPIRVHQLLSHTAGIPDDFSAPYGYEDAIYNLRGARVLFAPGTAFSYSNDGFATVGAVLAALDHRRWSDAVQHRVFDALGMMHSSPVFTPGNFGDTAVGYVLRDADRPEAVSPPLVPAPPFDFVDPAGSVISTPADMAAYIRLYLNGGKTDAGRQLISPAAFKRMTSPDDMHGKPAGAGVAVLAEAPALYRQYGFGLSISSDGGDRVVAHTGGISGYTACMEANLTRGFGVVALANLVEAPLHPCAIVLYAMRVLRAQSLGLPLPQPPDASDPAIVAHASAYAGTYHAADGSRLTITAIGRGARLHDGGATFTLYPRGADTFWTDDPRLARFELIFSRDRRHVVTDFTWGSKQFVGAAYRGPATFPYPAAYDALCGRYETDVLMQLSVTRVLIVKGKLTFDGDTPLVDHHDGTFRAGSAIVAFDHRFGGRPQRLRVDDVEMTRVELP
jgi:CubicO group peptidase (beta-lactamase class C family)